MRISVQCLAVLILMMKMVNAAEEPALGSAEFKPTTARPFGWRGDGSGHFPGATPPTAWSLKENIRWSTAIGNSYSSPILTDKVIFVTSEPNLLICLDRTNGQVRWKKEITPVDIPDEKNRKSAEEYEPPKDGSGMMAATPITDGASVYVVLANGIVRAYDLAGNPKWLAFISADQNTGYGRCASPLLVDGKLIVHMTYLYAFDAATGKELWVNKEAESTYGSPCAVKAGDVSVIVTSSGDVIRADTGKHVASGAGEAHYTTPIASDGTVYFGENAVTATLINAADKTQELWNSAITGDVFGSPLLIDNTLFVVTAKGQLFTYDVKGKGENNPLNEPRALFAEDPAATPNAVVSYASLTRAGKLLFLNSTRGETEVLEANRAAKSVAKNALKSGSGASLIFSGSEIFIRDGDKLLCISEKVPK